MKESPGALELLSSRVDDLERRVHALEHPEESRSSSAVQSIAPQNLDASDTTPRLETGNLFPILGRAMLGVAGAYVLRAAAEASVLPRLPISLLAVLYAFAWLAWSPRARGNVARIVYAGTSALILVPLLWENTLRFHVFPPSMSAGVLAAFLTLATALEVRDGSAANTWIPQAIAVCATAVLAFATRDVLPFVIALLITVSLTEFARTRSYAPRLWPLIVLVADAACCGLIFIYSGPQNARTAYPDLGPAALIAPAAMLFAINGTAIVSRVLVRENRIGLFETTQVVIAFGLAAAGVLTFAPQQGAITVGGFSLVLAVCAYIATFRLLRQRSDQRNLRVFSTWSAALLLAGSLWALPRAGAAIGLAIAAIAATWLARRVEPVLFEFHAALLLTAAAISVGLPQYIFDVLAGTSPQKLAAATVIVSVCSAVIFVVGDRQGDGALQKTLQFLPALIAVFAWIALLVHSGLAGAAALVPIQGHHIAFLRTLTICLAALGMAFSGSRWARIELTHLAYVVLAFVAAKLLFEDLRHGHMEFIAGSIALFAVTLIAAPRLVRLGARLRAAVPGETPVHSHS